MKMPPAVGIDGEGRPQPFSIVIAGAAAGAHPVSTKANNKPNTNPCTKRNFIRASYFYENCDNL
jgi:hypothetical protein